jgi:hypothetical protein
MEQRTSVPTGAHVPTTRHLSEADAIMPFITMNRPLWPLTLHLVN